MRIAMPALVCAALVFLGIGCSKGPNLEGTWTVDMAAFKESDDFKNASEGEQKLMESSMKSLKIVVASDTMEMTMSLFGTETTKKQKYKVTKTDGNKVTIESTDLDKEGKEVEGAKPETVTFTIDGDTMIMPSKGGEPAMKMKRS